MRFGLSLILAFASSLLAPLAAEAGAPSTAPSVGKALAVKPRPILHPDRQIELLTHKVGPMILVGFAGTGPGDPGTAMTIEMVRQGRIGGVVLFADNVAGPEQVRRLTAALRGAAGALPPLIAIDQEGGQIQRLTRRKGFTNLPSARRIARMDPGEACARYAATAAELAGLGINVNFGPVVDLDINPASPAIGRKARSYGTDPAIVVAYARQFVEAHSRAGILTSAKHFPGHGSAILDSHDRPVDISATWQANELAPFESLIAGKEIDMVMVGHLIHPRFSDGELPASLSRRAIGEELRGRLGFDGIVVTDDLGMGAIASRYPVEDAAVMAVRAGADLLIVANREHPDPGIADRIAVAVAGAVASGSIAESALDRSLARLSSARARIGGTGIGGTCPPPPADPDASEPVAVDARSETAPSVVK